MVIEKPDALLNEFHTAIQSTANTRESLGVLSKLVADTGDLDRCIFSPVSYMLCQDPVQVLSSKGPHQNPLHRLSVASAFPPTRDKV